MEQEIDIDTVMNDVASGMDLDGTDDTGDDSGADDVSHETGDAGTQAATTTEVDEYPMPPSWKKEWEPDWKLTPKQARQRFMEREKQMLDGLEQYKGDAGYGRSLREVFNPYQDFLKQQGVDEAKAVQYLLNAHYRLSQGSPEEKASYWQQLAQSYGLAQQQQTDAQPLPPQVQQALDRINRIEGTLTQQQQEQRAQRLVETQSKVNAFAEDPAHPHFDECAEDIGKLIKAGYDLESAYQTAIYANPVVRAKELARIQTEAAKALKEKAKQTAMAARKATSANVNPANSSRTPTEGKATMDDMDNILRETAAEIRAKTH